MLRNESNQRSNNFLDYFILVASFLASRFPSVGIFCFSLSRTNHCHAYFSKIQNHRPIRKFSLLVFKFSPKLSIPRSFDVRFFVFKRSCGAPSYDAFLHPSSTLKLLFYLVSSYFIFYSCSLLFGSNIVFRGHYAFYI